MLKYYIYVYMELCVPKTYKKHPDQNSGPFRNAQPVCDCICLSDISINIIGLMSTYTVSQHTPFSVCSWIRLGQVERDTITLNNYNLHLQFDLVVKVQRGLKPFSCCVTSMLKFLRQWLSSNCLLISFNSLNIFYFKCCSL